MNTTKTQHTPAPSPDAQPVTAPSQFFVTSTAGTRGKTITAKDKRSARTVYSNITGCGFKNCKVVTAAKLISSTLAAQESAQ